MKKLLEFLFGKGPQIFDKDGNVRHDLPKSTWENWNNRYQMGPEYNWRNHVGFRAGGDNAKNSRR
jgi:hypothetical protein